jgi:DNA-binding NarL/FixJ family response regulator
MEMKKVVLVGHCGADGSYLRLAVNKAVKGASVLLAYDEASLKKLIDAGPDLILLNRQLDYGFPEDEGVGLIKRLRASHPALKMMLVSNYEDAQEAAVQAGALPGFGKRELGTPRVTQLLRAALEIEERVTG